MREVKVAKSAGFCFGVTRAVDTVYEQVEKGLKVCTLGPIIHNEQVVNDMEAKGVRVIDSVDDIKDGEDITVIIRSHGVSEEVMNKGRGEGLGDPRRNISLPCPPRSLHDTEKHSSKLNRAEVEAAVSTQWQKLLPASGSGWKWSQLSALPRRFKIPDPAK